MSLIADILDDVTNKDPLVYVDNRNGKIEFSTLNNRNPSEITVKCIEAVMEHYESDTETHKDDQSLLRRIKSAKFDFVRDVVDCILRNGMELEDLKNIVGEF